MGSGLRRLCRGVPVLVAALGLACATVLPAAPAAAQSRPNIGRPGQEPAEVVDGEILVKFKSKAPEQRIAEAHRRGGGQEKEPPGPHGVRVVSVQPGQERSRAAKYREDPDVEFAEVNGLAYAIGFTPNDPRYPTQWQYENTGANGGVADADIDASGAWQVTMGSSSAVIAILDSGIDQSHEDLRSKVTRSVNFTSSRKVDDEFGHGTHVAGTAGAQTNNRVGVAGTCPSCPLFNVKVLDASGSGPWSGVASGITWAADNGAKVINMSLGSYAPSQTLEAAVNYAVGKGVVVVAAAGNDGQNWGFYPAA